MTPAHVSTKAVLFAGLPLFVVPAIAAVFAVTSTFCVRLDFHSSLPFSKGTRSMAEVAGHRPLSIDKHSTSPFAPSGFWCCDRYQWGRLSASTCVRIFIVLPALMDVCPLPSAAIPNTRHLLVAIRATAAEVIARTSTFHVCLGFHPFLHFSHLIE